MDRNLQQFIQAETEKQKLQSVVHELTEKCWDSCVDRPGPKLDHKTQDCLKMCVDRFLDVNIMVAGRMEQKGRAALAAQSSDDLF